jgi:hypothetical protein
MAQNNFNLPALVSDLPPEAIRSDTLLITLNLEWFKGAVIEDQYKAMKAWFLARYCDPSDTTPYSPLEGKYIFVHGGPFRPDDVLFKEFGTLAKDEVIQGLASDLERAVGSKWAPVIPTSSEGELRFAQDVYYDERFGFYVPDPGKPFSDLETV